MTTASRLIAWAVLLGFAFAIANAEDSPQLTLQEAHEAALRSHPQISVADLKALAARQVTRQFRSAFFPTLSANAVAVGTANDNTRLSAIGALNNPSIFDRNAEGLILSQLITDFGRTANLTGSAKLRAQAEANNAQATREQILLAVDGAFFSAQQAQSVTRVAEQTVAERQVFLDQVSALATNKLRSDLDVSFARVNVEDGKLLLEQGAERLAGRLCPTRQPHGPARAEDLPPGGATDAAGGLDQCLGICSARPPIPARLAQPAELAGSGPQVRPGGKGPALSHPLRRGQRRRGSDRQFCVGGQLRCRRSDRDPAALRRRPLLRAPTGSRAPCPGGGESLRDLENNVVRDVRIAWLNAQNAFDRLRITGQLLDNAKQSFDLAQARYSNGISSIVEFNQAQLNLLSAQIAYADTQYEYLLRRSALSFQVGALH